MSVESSDSFKLELFLWLRSDQQLSTYILKKDEEAFIFYLTAVFWKVFKCVWLWPFHSKTSVNIMNYSSVCLTYTWARESTGALFEQLQALTWTESLFISQAMAQTIKWKSSSVWGLEALNLKCYTVLLYVLHTIHIYIYIYMDSVQYVKQHRVTFQVECL